MLLLRIADAKAGAAGPVESEEQRASSQVDPDSQPVSLSKVSARQPLSKHRSLKQANL
jgi:hypothetical protein